MTVAAATVTDVWMLLCDCRCVAAATVAVSVAVFLPLFLYKAYFALFSVQGRRQVWVLNLMIVLQIINIQDIIRAPTIAEMKDVYPL